MANRKIHQAIDLIRKEGLSLYEATTLVDISTRAVRLYLRSLPSQHAWSKQVKAYGTIDTWGLITNHDTIGPKLMTDFKKMSQDFGNQSETNKKDLSYLFTRETSQRFYVLCTYKKKIFSLYTT